MHQYIVDPAETMQQQIQEPGFWLPAANKFQFRNIEKMSKIITVIVDPQESSTKSEGVQQFHGIAKHKHSII